MAVTTNTTSSSSSESGGGNLSKSSSQERADLVAYWSVPLLDGVHTIEFEHGTTTGKRVLRVDGKEIIRRDWMFKLVGEERFTISGGGKCDAKCELHVDPLPHFAFAYSLLVDGKSLEKFTERQSQCIRSWAVLLNGKRYRIVFEKQTLNILVNGQYIETEDSVFVSDGTEMRFEFEDFKGIIKASSADRRQGGVIHQLFVDGKLIEEDIVF